MIGSESSALSNRILHFASALRGTCQYWMKQRSRLISMVNTLGLPTVFLTHSAADIHWPELAELICPNNPQDRAARTRAVIENPAIADWFFYHRIKLYLHHFYVDILHVVDYWVRFEWQHRGSPHIHGLAWLPNAPDVEKLKLSSEIQILEVDRNRIVRYIDSIVSTINPSINLDGSNHTTAP